MAGALGSLFKVGGKNRGQRRRGRRGARIDGVNSGVKKMVELRLGYGRGVPVEDCITTTGSMPGKGCNAMGFEGRRDGVWGAVKEGGGQQGDGIQEGFWY